MEYQINKPYPNPAVERPNIEYAKILSQTYAGNISEETAIHLYFFQAMILKEKYPDISFMLKKIAIVEMHHLALLGETIKLLGLTPKYEAYQNNTAFPWQTRLVNYEENLKKILEIDITEETMTIQNYEIQKVSINDKYVQNLIERIIEDEYLHLNLFISTYNELTKNQECS